MARPITKDGLDLFEAAVDLPNTPENSIHDAISEIYAEREKLGGQNVLSLQIVVRAFDIPQAEKLRKVIFRPWLLEGIEKCAQDCRTVVRTHIDSSLPWTPLALELHKFYTTMRESLDVFPLMDPNIKAQLQALPPVEQLISILDIYVAAQAQRPKVANVSSKQHTVKETIGPEDNSTRSSVPPTSPREPSKAHHPLEDVIQGFCVHHLLEPSIINYATQRTISAILHVWESTEGPQVDSDRRSLAILVSKHTGENHGLRNRCLAEIALGNKLLESPSLVRDLLNTMLQVDAEPEQAIVTLTNLLTKREAWTQCWRDLLYMWLEQENQPGVFWGTNLIEHSLRTMKAAEWLSFMYHLETLFLDLPISNSEEHIIPSILQPQLLSWKTQVSRFTGTLTRLEDALEDQAAVRSMLICGEGMWKKNIVSILECLAKAEGKPVETLMQKAVGKLPSNPSKAWEVKECLFDLLNATPETVHACEKIWDAKHGFLDIPGLSPQVQVAESPVSSRRGIIGKAASMRPTTPSHPAPSTLSSVQPISPESIPAQKYDVPLSIAEVMIAGWIQDDNMDAVQKSAIMSVALLLELEVYRHNIPPKKLAEAVLFWEKIGKEIVEEAERLERLQKVLKAKDPKGTRLLLQALGVPDNSLMDEEIMSLPMEINDAVERIGYSEVEISFPLTASELQRGAMGIPSPAKILLLRLFIDHTGDMPPSFCMHYNDEVDLNSEAIKHTPWICSQDSKSPQHVLCRYRPTAFTWQLNRIVHTRLRGSNISIADLHTFVKKNMEEMSHLCVSCGTSHKAKNARLRRSTPCDIIACAQLWYQLPLDVRIPETKTDTFAVDMALTSVYAAAMSGRAELLPGCPIYGVEAIKTILNSLPSLTVLSHAVNVSTVLKSYHKDAEKLISWACVHFRGYLASATGICKIPNLPAGTHQFILANASPKLENDFVSRLPKPNSKTTVLFHGTSLDRLPAILSQGLKTCSGTSLQRTGAAHGKGIYMAEDPSTSLMYAPASLSWKNSGLTNMRLLLGCEVVGNGRSVSSGVHVVTDEKSVMVRYVFLFTTQASSPVANHIIPAMASGMSALRSGAV